jgi:hypothetical protein
MVRATAPAAATPEVADLPEPTWAFLVRRGGPAFAIEGIGPVLLFYGVWHVAGLVAGVVVATGTSASVLVWQQRRGQGGWVATLTLVFLVVQAAVGLASKSATVYLAQPVVLSAGWGVAYLASAAIRRPLIGVFANAWYPFPAWFRASAPYKREFGLQSVVWGVYLLGRAALRLAALLNGGVAGFVVVSFATGTPFMFGLIGWGLGHARRSFARLEVAEDADLDRPEAHARTSER